MTLFGTAGIRGDVREAVDPELALAVGRAAARHAVTTDDSGSSPSFALGIDGRETSEGLAAAAAAGLASGGAEVEQIGRVPTPTLAFASRGRRGVMITASHNPPTDNGIKLFHDGVEYDGEAESRVEELVAADPAPGNWDEWGSIRDGSVLDAYRGAVVDYLTERFPEAIQALAGQRVAVDCGNGVAGLATPQILGALGATPVALNANVDGSFPARESKPTPESLTGLRRLVAADEQIAIGIGHDGDGDRLAVVDPDGDVVHEDTVLAVIAERYVRDSAAGDPVVVTTPNASGRIDERVAAAGGRTERIALGLLHEGIARERAAGGDDTAVVFAAEPWKHVHPAFGGWIDAIVSAALIAALAAEAGGIERLTADVVERPYRKENVPCPDAAKTAAMRRVEAALPERFESTAVDTEYGIRVELAGGGWVLVRPSGTEPYLRIYAEADAVDEVVTTARGVVEGAVEAA
ncbi:phosphoglucosamine mutase [Salinarchaeum sp. Harcht-Bsk1]|uniref:phosphoglucosamine mutase n=1 Tax=Salinarchaeum sp. Harcht-Bsk1 TaxID=1333523 RepID=UPI0003422CFC|nr:phosphoglucosamine mutase [Salinarchaeum sp. Harcht-Bsk1]AGN02614.1 phosphoglucosamine mutase [Salinarchaeum sp. Harcht-Bsk1]